MENHILRACDNLGIKGVDLYGVTLHSAFRELRKYRTPEEITVGSMHSTNKAFERYFQVEPNNRRNIYRDMQSGNNIRKAFPAIPEK